MNLEQTQIDMEYMYAKNQTVKRLWNYFVSIEADKAIEKVGLPVEFGLDLMVQMELHKRATVGVLVGILHKHFEDYENPFQVCANALHHSIEKKLVDWSEIDERFVVRHRASKEILDEIAKFQYPLPMVVEPKEIEHNKQTGYMTIKGSVILKDNYHDDDVCLDHLNAMNKVPLCMNPTTVRMVQNQWTGLAKPKDGETFQDYKKRVDAFEKYDSVSRDVLDSLFTLGNEFYLTHKYDKRGRTYAQGYHVNYQGNDWNKAVVEFADKEMVE